MKSDEQADSNSICYPAAVDVKLEKLAQGLRRSKKELFGQMVDYFHRKKTQQIMLMRSLKRSFLTA